MLLFCEAWSGSVTHKRSDTLQRLHSKGNPYLCSSAQPEVTTSPSRQPAVQRHVRSLCEDAQTRLRARQSTAQCRNRSEFDRRLDLGL